MRSVDVLQGLGIFFALGLFWTKGEAEESVWQNRHALQGHQNGYQSSWQRLQYLTKNGRSVQVQKIRPKYQVVEIRRPKFNMHYMRTPKRPKNEQNFKVKKFKEPRPLYHPKNDSATSLPSDNPQFYNYWKLNRPAKKNYVKVSENVRDHKYHRYPQPSQVVIVENEETLEETDKEEFPDNPKESSIKGSEEDDEESSTSGSGLTSGSGFYYEYEYYEVSGSGEGDYNMIVTNRLGAGKQNTKPKAEDVDRRKLNDSVSYYMATLQNLLYDMIL